MKFMLRLSRHEWLLALIVAVPLIALVALLGYVIIWIIGG